jgi:uncharacterized protein YhaN
MFVETDSCL